MLGLALNLKILEMLLGQHWLRLLIREFNILKEMDHYHLRGLAF
jgi:hypothetical protein